MNDREHPASAELQRLLYGEATRDEARAIVRHLLAGCPECAAVIRPMAGFRGGTNGGREVHAVIEGAKQEMRSAGRDLLSIRYRLLGVRASILPTSEEISKGDLTGDPDVATELRIVIDCNVQDHLGPLIESILKGASDQPETREADSNAEALSIAHLDFSVFSEETRQRLYEVVAAENFGPTEEEPAEEPVQYTAEQAGLEVVFAWGRWFAAWWKLELPETLPEAERREILLLHENSYRPGTLAYGEI